MIYEYPPKQGFVAPLGRYPDINRVLQVVKTLLDITSAIVQ